MEGLAITTDLPCVGCGHNLRTRPVDGVCTECGLAVKQSLDRTILQWGPTRLRRIAHGLRIQAITTLVVPPILAAGILAEWYLSKSKIYQNTENMWIGIYVTLGLVSALHVVGAWRATSAPRGDKHVLSRWLCRLSGILFPTVMFGFAILVLLRTRVTLGTYLLTFSLSAMMAAWAIYAERAAACWTVFHRRAGLANRAGMGKWSMRFFSPLACILAASLCAIFGMEALDQLGLYHLDSKVKEFVFTVAQPTLGGVLVAMGILLILISIALFRGATRALELARLAEITEHEGFTSPLATATDAPSCS